MMRSFTVSIATAGALGVTILAGAAAASEDDRRGAMTSRADWMSVSALAAKLEGQGYAVREIEIDDGRYEVEMTDANGLRIEGYFDPVSGAPIGRDRSDD